MSLASAIAALASRIGFEVRGRSDDGHALRTAVGAAARQGGPAVVRIGQRHCEMHPVSAHSGAHNAGDVVGTGDDHLPADVAKADPGPGDTRVTSVDLGFDFKTNATGQSSDGKGQAHQTKAPSKMATKSVSVLPTSAAATAPMLVRA